MLSLRSLCSSGVVRGNHYRQATHYSPVFSPHSRLTTFNVSAHGSNGSRGQDLCSPEQAQWESVTSKLVGLASVPFSILVLPQVITNYANIASGNAAALSVISWQGYASALMGNTLMCSHFAHRAERSAVNVQLIGIASNLLVLSQVMIAGVMPKPLFAAIAFVVAGAVAISLARVGGRIPGEGHNGKGMGLWRMWQLLAGVGGLAMVAQVLYNTMFPAIPSILPGLAALTLLTAYFGVKLKAGDTRQYGLVEQLPGWASTFLFTLAPLPQLVQNLLNPQGLEGLSVGTMLLALTGNALMVPRALLTKDLVWLAGTTWSLSVAGWGQLLSMFLAKSQETGARYLNPPAFAAITVVMLAYLAFVLRQNARAQHSEPASPSPS
uniref:Uncharacterized protein n=1 Tax=Dunaliella tertiolecta TaxID=3047 RepID=A0A7S3QXK1_DUNTE|mmetsp:Transcript_4162/g.9675  ORF Transcript_4162/g.9675 Transcript_4162/m.9675 type:complete len:381 (+) Transcript_4162:34-1176(+)